MNPQFVHFGRLVLLLFFTLAVRFSSWATDYFVLNTNDSGTGSLRQAILDANANVGPNTIKFQIPGTGPFIINPHSTYPPLTQPVIIDGTSQPGYTRRPLIDINGAEIGASGDGLMISGGGSSVLGLAIYRCKRDGIRLSGFGTNVVRGCYLGTDHTGTNSLGNAGAGIYVFRSSGNLIGGTTTADRNVISANAHGVYIDDGAPPPIGSGNIVQGNYIGTTDTGTAALGNTNNGVYITQAPGNLIGGTPPGTGNLISGNFLSGVYLLGSAAVSNVIAGNLIGTDVSGSSALGNRLDGITIYGASTNWIGGLAPGAGNVVSGNSARGILIVNAGTTNATGNVAQGNFIGTDRAGLAALPNHTNGVMIVATCGNLIGSANPAGRNLISGNLQNGILVTQPGASNNVVQGNFIGTDVSGTKALPNTYSGVTLDSAAADTIGGTNSGEGNLVSGNLQNGIYMKIAGGGHRIQGNRVGTDASGQFGVSNAFSGVWIETAGNLVGGTDSSARNVISGNARSGIYLAGAGASNNLIQGNYVGIGAGGLMRVGNGASGLYSGIYFDRAPGNTVGGSLPGAGNVISGNGDKGISLNGTGSSGNIFLGNYIGTDPGGSGALPNANGGIYIFSASANRIGGTNAGDGNLISGNDADGIYVSGASNTVIQGNFVGTQANGSGALGNLWHNIEFLNGSSDNLVGGNVPAADNRIAFTRTPQYDGVRVRTGCVANQIQRNSFFSNGAGHVNGLGICVGAVGVKTNGLPVFTTAISDGQTLIVKGSMLNTPDSTFKLQLYANIVTNISGYGEGLTWLAATNLVTGHSGNTAFAIQIKTPVPEGQFISATVTDSTNSTSEFAADIRVQSPPSLSLIVSNYVVDIKAGAVGTAYYLAWSTNPPGFSLVQTTNLIPPAIWVPFTNPPAIVGNEFRLLMPVTNSGSRFFRLRFQ